MVKKKKRSIFELKLIFKVVEKVTSLDLEEVLSEIVEIATEVTKADSCLLYLYDGKKKELVLKASKNPHKNVLGKIKMKLGEGITGWVAQQKEPVAIAEGAGNDSRFKYFAALPEDKYEAFLSVPILFKNKIVGVINIQHKKRHEYNHEIELLITIGRIVGAAVVNAQLIERALELQEALKTRALLERAKSILMKNTSISEEEAHSRIQRASMNSGKSLASIAEAIILTDKLMR